jgi:hypothetical protein
MARSTNLAKIIPAARYGDTMKVVSARETVRLIRSGDTLAISGFAGMEEEAKRAMRQTISRIP